MENMKKPASDDLHQVDEDIFTSTASDEDLESAAGAEPRPKCTTELGACTWISCIMPDDRL
jgi:hypothetical protein